MREKESGGGRERQGKRERVGESGREGGIGGKTGEGDLLSSFSCQCRPRQPSWPS